jgi:GT2 family glycosyltransferase
VRRAAATSEPLGGEARVRVVVPTFRRPELLPRLVKSLEAQTLPLEDFEVCIVEDGGGDTPSPGLAALAAASPLRLIPVSTSTNVGPAAARNLGWRSAATPFLAFTDDDCEPEPGWLEAGVRALESDSSLGVVQGATKRPSGPVTDWTVYREVLAATPWFEGCNLFFRREAVVKAGGFSELRRFFLEDTELGWKVVDLGWSRGFAADAVVWHDNAERGVSYHIREAWREGRLCSVARRYPGFREMLWRPWAVRPLNVAFCLAVVGVAGSFWKRPWLLLVLPYVRMRRPPTGHHRYVRLATERLAVDATVFVSMKVGAVKARQFLL